jgi:hypothetical protein
MALQNCLNLSKNRQDFRNNATEYEMSTLQLSFETFLNLRRKERDMITNVYWSCSKVAAFIFWKILNEIWNLATDFLRILKY